MDLICSNNVAIRIEQKDIQKFEIFKQLGYDAIYDKEMKFLNVPICSTILIDIVRFIRGKAWFAEEEKRKNMKYLSELYKACLYLSCRSFAEVVLQQINENVTQGLQGFKL